ncbi:MAG: hypothetical protein R3E68_11195 [Burkholderiaceae bacterium]
MPICLGLGIAGSGLERKALSQEARGKIYDSLVITVEVRKDGMVEDIIINRKSEHEVLNRAVREIVLAGACRESSRDGQEGISCRSCGPGPSPNRKLQTSEAQGASAGARQARRQGGTERNARPARP